MYSNSPSLPPSSFLPPPLLLPFFLSFLPLLPHLSTFPNLTASSYFVPPASTNELVCVCDPSTSSLPSIRHAIHSDRPIYQVVPFLPPTHPPDDEMDDDSSFRRFLPPRIMIHGYLERDCHAILIPPWRTSVRDLRRRGNRTNDQDQGGNHNQNRESLIMHII